MCSLFAVTTSGDADEEAAALEELLRRQQTALSVAAALGGAKPALMALQRQDRGASAVPGEGAEVGGGGETVSGSTARASRSPSPRWARVVGPAADSTDSEAATVVPLVPSAPSAVESLQTELQKELDALLEEAEQMAAATQFYAEAFPVLPSCVSCGFPVPSNPAGQYATLCAKCSECPPSETAAASGARRRPPPALNPATIAEDVARLQQIQEDKEKEKEKALLAWHAADLKRAMMRPGDLADQIQGRMDAGSEAVVPVKAAPQPLVAARAIQATKANIAAVERYNEGVVRAVCENNLASLTGWASKAHELQVDREVLRITGIGFLMANKSLSSLAAAPTRGRTAADLASTVVARWRDNIAKQTRNAEVEAYFATTPNGLRPLGKRGAGPFLEAVAALNQHARLSDPQVRPEIAHKAATSLALLGIGRPDDLTRLLADCPALTCWGPTVQTTAAAMIRVAHRTRRIREAQEEATLTTDLEAMLQRIQAGREGGDQAAVLPRDASLLADLVMAADFVEEPGELPGWTGGPRDRVAALTQSDAPMALLDAEASRLKKRSRKDLKSVAAALRCWHHFAILGGYQPAGTFPPRLGSHVERFVGLFRHGPTAANDVSCLRWAATWSRQPTDWDTRAARQAIKGSVAEAKAAQAGKGDDRFRFTSTVLRATVEYLDALDPEGEAQVASLISWQALLRAQSECVQLARRRAPTTARAPQLGHVGRGSQHHIAIGGAQETAEGQCSATPVPVHRVRATALRGLESATPGGPEGRTAAISPLHERGGGDADAGGRRPENHRGGPEGGVHLEGLQARTSHGARSPRTPTRHNHGHGRVAKRGFPRLRGRGRGGRRGGHPPRRRRGRCGRA
ncbi:hypothetical protein N9L68_06460 [bacterium]|nr:hypothetical protein [bacterium]